MKFFKKSILFIIAAALISASAFPAFGAETAFTEKKITDNKNYNLLQKISDDMTTNFIENNAVEFTSSEINFETYKDKKIIKSNDSLFSKTSFTTSDSKIVVIDENGVARPMCNKGTATITGTDLMTGNTAQCKVTVNIPIKAEGVTLDSNYCKLTKKGQTFKLKANVFPKAATNKDVTFSSSDKKIATVSNDGTVTAVSSDGKAEITAKTKDGAFIAKCVAEVKIPVKVDEISLDYKSFNYVGNWDKSQKLTAKVYPSNATNKSVKWSSSNDDVATVDKDGKITPVNNGTCTITCIASDGSNKNAKCDITVSNVEEIITTTTIIEQPSVLVQNTPVANSIIEEAEKYVGVLPYVWGGTSLQSGADCSGFVCAIYDRFGYNLWGLRTDLRYAGVEVPDISQAQAGDILVYSGHVALYDGNGGRIHEPDVGHMAEHSSYLGNYYTIRRIIS